METKTEILLVTKEQETLGVVRDVFAESRDFSLTNVYHDLAQVRSCLSHTKVQVLVVDIDPDPVQMLRNVGIICDISPRTFVVIVGYGLTKDLILQAMRSGARHFIEKKALASELLEGLQSLIHDDKKREMGSGSVVIPVFSAGGGCGATTIAINLASELRLLSKKRTLAIDLDGFYGAISTYLGIKSQYGIADVLSANNNMIDVDLIRSSAYQYNDNLHVLTSPAGSNASETGILRYENLNQVVEACRQIYEYTIIDAPRLPYPSAINLAKLSDIVVIVFQLTVKDVKNIRSIISSLTEAGIARERILPIANRVKKRGPLVRFEDTKKLLGLSSCKSIRSDWRKAMKSVNYGKPLAEAVKRSGLRRDIQGLAVKVSKHGKNGSIEILR